VENHETQVCTLNSVTSQVQRLITPIIMMSSPSPINRVQELHETYSALEMQHLGLSKLNRTKQHKHKHGMIFWMRLIWNCDLDMHNTGCWIIYRWTYFEDNPQVSSANQHIQLHINTTHPHNSHPHCSHDSTPTPQHNNTQMVHTSRHTVHTYTSTHTTFIQMLGTRIRRSSF